MIDKTNTSQSQYISALPGLIIALILPPLYALLIAPFFVRPVVSETMAAIIGMSFMWMLVVLLVSYNLYVERYYILSLRLFRITLKKAAIAAAIGLGLSMLVPLFYLGLGMLFPEAVDDTLGTVSSLSPFLVLAGVITAAVCEEVLFRAYPLERLEGSFNKKWPGVIISLLAFVVVHAESWSALHIFGIVMPMGVVLTYLYLKTRRLTFVILVHFFFDLPLFIMTLIE